jgi:hypothetical protein
MSQATGGRAGIEPRVIESLDAAWGEKRKAISVR